MRRSLALRAARAHSSSSPAAAAAPDSSSGGKTNIVLWHGYVDVEGKALTAAAKRFNATHPKIHVTVQNYGNADYALNKVLTAIRGGSLPRHRVPVRLVGREHGPHAQGGRPGAAHQGRPVDQLERLLARRAPGRDRRPQDRRRPGARRQPGPRLQQEALRSGRHRLPDRRLDVGRLPRRGQAADGPVGEAVRLGVRERRERGHGVALRRAPVAGRRRHPDARPEARGVQLPGRCRGRHPAPADGDRRPLGLPRQRQRQLRQPLQLGQDRHALHRAVGPLRVPGRRLRHPDPPGQREPPDDLGPRPVGDARQRRRRAETRRGRSSSGSRRRPRRCSGRSPPATCRSARRRPRRRRTRSTRPSTRGSPRSSTTSRTRSRRGPVLPTYNEISQAMGQAIQAILLGKAQPQQALDQAAQQVDQILAQGGS